MATPHLSAAAVTGPASRPWWFVVTLLWSGVLPAVAQDPTPSSPDSVGPVTLGEIVVAVRADAPVTSTHTETRISAVDIEQRDATVVADLARLIPSAHVQTNSRGETLVYLRNAGERQVGVFFEGALLNVPWDNRVDLSLVPAGVTGGITVATGVIPVEYGTNVLGGAVNLTARPTRGPWAETELVARFGTQDRRMGSVTHRGRKGAFSYTGSFSYAEADGLRVPSGADLPYSQPANQLRTNTDSRVTNLFANGAYDFGNARLGLTLLHVDARKGVAPEGHLDPAVSRVRYWRYPDWRNTMAIVSGEGFLKGTAWKGAAWVNGFSQAIESYDSPTYDDKEARQEDDDLTLGSRFIVSAPLGAGLGKAVVNWLISTHKQRDMALDATGRPGGTLARLRFQQHLLSVGAEYALDPLPGVSLTFGGSVDAMVTPQTGDKPHRDPIADYGVTAAASYAPSEAWFLRGALGRKTRFPTMRELFGEALNRFAINPDLDPESSIIGEVAVGFTAQRLAGEVIPFFTIVSNTIDQQSVTVEGETRPRRQRINLEGSRVLGVELVGTAPLLDNVTVEGNLTLMSVRRRNAADGEPTTVSEKPEALGRLSARYESPAGTSATIETVYTGRAYSLDETNEFVPLDRSLVVNLRLAQEVEISPSQTVEIFLHVENAADEVVLPQLGLPDGGRTVTGGVRMAF